MIFILLLWSKQGPPKGKMADGGGGGYVVQVPRIKYSIYDLQSIT